MPSLTKNKVTFKNFAAWWFSPFVSYLDLESLIVPVATVKNHPNVSSTHALETSTMQLLLNGHRARKP